MTEFRGPDPSEALPIGEDSLSPEELDIVAGIMLELQDPLSPAELELINHCRESLEFTPEALAAMRRTKTELELEYFELLRSSLLMARTRPQL